MQLLAQLQFARWTGTRLGANLYPMTELDGRPGSLEPPAKGGWIGPARRATDHYLGIGLAGVAILLWLIMFRLALRHDPAVWLYVLPTALVTYGAAGMVLSLRKDWGRRSQSRANRLARPPDKSWPEVRDRRAQPPQ
jgi:hypothetical protein